MEVGYGHATVTAELGTPCALGIDNTCVEVFDPIHARVLHLCDRDEAVAFVSIDVIGLYAPETRALQAIVGDRLGIPPERAIIHATHTHQSPGVRMCVQDVLDEFDIPGFERAYFDRLTGELGDAAEQAADTTPVSVSVGSAIVERIASNRRCLDERGRIRFRASRPAAEMRDYPEGDIDPFLRLLRFDAEDGRQWALLSYACHPTSTGGDEAPYVTGDFPGEAMRRMEAQREGLLTTYGTGPCGNINPGKWVGDGDSPDERKRDRDAMGQRLAEAALNALESAQPVEEARLTFAREVIRLPFRDDFSTAEALRTELEEAVERYRERKGDGETGWGGFGLLNVARREAIRRQGISGFLETGVSAIGVGEVALAFMPGESFVEAGRAAIRAANGAFVMPIECVDCSPSYIPTPESYAVGGYEIGATPVSPLAFRIEVAAVARVVAEVLGQA